MKFSEMPYERPNKEKILQKMDDAIKLLQKAEVSGDAVRAMKEMEQIVVDVDTMGTICHVRNTVDTTDAFYEAERKYNDELSPVLSEKLQAFNKELLESRFRPELEKKYGKLLFSNMELDQRGFSPEIIPLMQEENLLEAEYQKLYASAKIPFEGKELTIAQLHPYKQNPDRAVRKAAWEAEGTFFDENREKFDEIFDKLVKNRTEQAKKLGFHDFVELGYIRRQRNCYGPKEVARFRQQVVEDLVPVDVEIKERQAKRIGLTKLKMIDDLFAFPDGNAIPQGTPDELLAAGKKMYEEMSPETAAFIDQMFEMDLFDVLAKEGKAPGGYCTTILGYNCPFIFSNFNGTSGDVDVLTHEAGHAFASYIASREIEPTDLRNPSMEGCETHSMSMEFLTAPWHHLFFKEQTAKYELSHAEDALIFIPYGCMVDHFQEIVYSHPELTPQQRNEEWLRLEKIYRPYMDHDGLPFYGRGAGWQRQLHIYLYPFYYVDYCLAQTAALQIWMEALENREKAWKKYFDLVKLGGTKTFVDLMESAGLQSPFEDGSIKKIAEPVRKWLNENQL